MNNKKLYFIILGVTFIWCLFINKLRYMFWIKTGEEIAAYIDVLISTVIFLFILHITYNTFRNS